MRLALVPALLAMLVGPASARQATPASPQDAATAPTPQTPVFRSGASLVALNVTVTDAGKKFITGLKPEDFSVYEDGVQQQVQFFESNNVPVDLIIMLDTSASMSDKMDVVHEAATGFLKTLRIGDRAAVVTFSDGVQVLQPLTEDLPALESAIDTTRAHGATALNNALYVAIKQFGRSAQQSGEVRRQAIAVLSDGEDTSSLMSFDDVMGLAKKSGVNIYTIGLQSKYAAARLSASGAHRYFSEAEYSMKTLAQETGAQAFFPLDISELKGVYALIAQELVSQYSIGYAPTNPRHDGRFRRIVVQIANRPELRPRARSGYTAEADRSAAVSSSSAPR
jgi:Ca-activated chloride channel family protein